MERQATEEEGDAESDEDQVVAPKDAVKNLEDDGEYQEIEKAPATSTSGFRNYVQIESGGTVLVAALWNTINFINSSHCSFVFYRCHLQRGRMCRS